MMQIDHPGLSQGEGYFERAYRIGNQTARVRFTPQRVESGLAASVNIPALPSVLAVAISASLVDGEGQVKRVAGQGLFQDAETHSWSLSDGETPDVEAWLFEKAEGVVAKLVSAAAIWRANELLIPAVPVVEAGRAEGVPTDDDRAAVAALLGPGQ